MTPHLRLRDDRWGLTCSTSWLSYASHFGLLEVLIGGAISAIGSAFGVTIPTWLSGALTAIATTAITIGLQYLLMPKPPKPADGKAPKVQAVPPVVFGVGRVRLAGAYMLWEEFEGLLYAVVALCGHKINAITKYFLHDDTVTLGAVDPRFLEVYQVNGGTDGRYGSGTVLMDSRLGLATETPYADAVAKLGPGGIWTNNHRGHGTASLFMLLTGASQKLFQSYYPYGICQPSVEAELAEVWDFRDEDQDPEDSSTWEWSQNPAVCLVWYLCFCPYGPKWNYVKAILPVLERWQEEADICDEAIPLAAGGTEPRYRVDGWATTETDPVAIVNSFLAACDGHLAQHGDGTLVLTVGKFREELVESISDVDFVGRHIQNDVPEEDAINRLVPRFTYPPTDYTSAVTDYFESTADQAKVGRVLSQEADLGWVHSWRQARRLAKREWLRIQTKKTGSFDLRLSAINAVHARWVRIESTIWVPSLNDRIIENRRSVLALQKGGFQMQWKLHPDNIDVWVPASDEGAAPPVPLRPDSEALSAPDIDTVVVIADAGTAYIRVVIIEPDRDDLIAVVRYRIVDTGSGDPGAWVEQRFPDAEPASGLVLLNTAPVPVDTELEVQAAFIGPRGSYSEWSTPPQFVSSVASEASLDFTKTINSQYLTLLVA